MDHILTALLSYVLVYKYAAIFVVIFVSSLLLPLPSNTLLLAAGSFASQSYMSASIIFIVALISNILGDSTGYMLTRRWGTRFITEAHMSRFSSVNKFRRFITEHARLTILMTRFLGATGIVVNFLAGILKIPYGKFLMYDIIGNALDIGFFVAAGYILGSYTENYSDIADLIGWIIFIAILLYAVVKIFLRHAHNSKIEGGAN